MDYRILKKLANNPFYKMNKDQLKELNEYERTSMVTFGVPVINENKFIKHEILTKKSYKKPSKKK